MWMRVGLVVANGGFVEVTIGWRFRPFSRSWYIIARSCRAQKMRARVKSIDKLPSTQCESSVR